LHSDAVPDAKPLGRDLNQSDLDTFLSEGHSGNSAGDSAAYDEHILDSHFEQVSYHATLRRGCNAMTRDD
jgi:hypothetical protein